MEDEDTIDYRPVAQLIFSAADTAAEAQRRLRMLNRLRPPIGIRRTYWRAYRSRIRTLNQNS